MAARPVRCRLSSLRWRACRKPTFARSPPILHRRWLKPGEGDAHLEDKQADAKQSNPQGAELYAGICATCHETGGHVPFTTKSLGQHTSLHGPDPRNVIHVILEGIHPA